MILFVKYSSYENSAEHLTSEPRAALQREQKAVPHANSLTGRAQVVVLGEATRQPHTSIIGHQLDPQLPPSRQTQISALKVRDFKTPMLA